MAFLKPHYFVYSNILKYRPTPILEIKDVFETIVNTKIIINILFEYRRTIANIFHYFGYMYLGRNNCLCVLYF